MTEEYSEYLNSEAWQKKRHERLVIAKYRCSACPKNKAVHVHHLTYERIFNEDMADLLPLCEDHHKATEELIANGKLSRRGDVLFLVTETMRLLLQHTREVVVKKYVSAEARNPVQDRFLNDLKFLELLMLPRKKFKKAIKRFFGHKPKLVCNALVLYDRKGSILSNQTQNAKSQSVHISRGYESQNGFRQPAKKGSVLI